MENPTFNKLNLSKLKICNQYWEEMEPTEGGRICTKCSNLIRDFRGKSDLEIALTYINSEGPVCGLYSEEQLKNKNVNKARIQNNWWKSAFLALATLFTSENTLASDAPTQPQIELLHSENARLGEQVVKGKNKQVSVSDSVEIQGKVTDATDMMPIYGIMIVVKETNIHTFTDVDGKYTIQIPNSLWNQGDAALVFTFIGYAQKELTVGPSHSYIHDVSLSRQMELTEFVVSTKRPPLHKRVWRWLTKPFRK
ncbi:carboxypeptidase-like regulatory domain-containing protein [Rapidithrix thailandica]|uniref:Carboxypeptidase-like regulatory domain-containing protein n=1 Tax=Rapidithrix thailandica TaxID=413964 RepID=A0AAW9SMD4_9BACT